ncbi:hypothetical protein ACTHTU_01335 [Neisseria sp. P0020.S005]|uniref:hypothetical protein n=1 Tax=Neisseria sp. P0020.S005 TaxID=3436810 RepID=UPI003F81862E
MKISLITVLAGMFLLTACSTNSDGSINWADNPIERAAQKINAGISGTNVALDSVANAGSKTSKKKSNDPLDETVYSDSKLTYRALLDLGYIRKNPDYPKHATEPYVFTSLNCSRGGSQNRMCLRNTRMIAPRP